MDKNKAKNATLAHEKTSTGIKRKVKYWLQQAHHQLFLWDAQIYIFLLSVHPSWVQSFYTSSSHCNDLSDCHTLVFLAADTEERLFVLTRLHKLPTINITYKFVKAKIELSDHAAVSV